MSRNTKTIAGEPVDVLERLLPDIELTKNDDGSYKVRFTTDIETGTAWQRAIERRAADLITVEHFEPFDSRCSTAFAQLVIDVAEATRGKVHDSR